MSTALGMEFHPAYAPTLSALFEHVSRCLLLLLPDMGKYNREPDVTILCRHLQDIDTLRLLDENREADRSLFVFTASSLSLLLRGQWRIHRR